VCPAGKRDCLAAGCGQHQFLKQHDEFRSGCKRSPKTPPFGDRIGGGIIAQAVDLPLIILDADL
jgi:hypothetical protein